MNAEQLSVEVYEELISFDYARKANEFSESGNTYFNLLKQEVKDAIRSFPVEYVDHRNDLMDIDNLDSKQQFYIFKNDLGYYLVDTQGYNYPRYITELHQFDYEEESDRYERIEGMLRIADGHIFDSVVTNIVNELNKEGFHRSEILDFLQFRLDIALEKVPERVG